MDKQRVRNWIRSFAACFGVCGGGGSEDLLFHKGTADVGVAGKVAKWPSTMSTDTLDFEAPIALSTPSSMPELIVFGRVQDSWVGSRDHVRFGKIDPSIQKLTRRYISTWHGRSGDIGDPPVPNRYL